MKETYSQAQHNNGWQAAGSYLITSYKVHVVLRPPADYSFFQTSSDDNPLFKSQATASKTSLPMF